MLKKEYVLYVIVSNVLSQMLNRAVERCEIGYHPRCKDVKLSHHSFADDIMVFTDGSPQSLSGTLRVFDDFAKMLGVNINIAKSTLYAGGTGKILLSRRLRPLDSRYLRYLQSTLGCLLLQRP